MPEQRDIARRLEQTQVVERPGASGFNTFYITGVWTPTLFGSGVAGTFTYDGTNTFGEYTRIGNRVLINGRVRATAITVAPTLNMGIGGLPVTSGVVGIAGTIHFGSWAGFTLTAGYTQVAGRIGVSATSALFIQCGSNVGAAVLQGAAMALVGGAVDFTFSGEYRV